MDLRNIAIIAHVDHGKTTLVDAMLKQSGTFRDNQKVAERAMDSNDLERERGITILAKCTSVDWQGHRINIVDTPGHADFGGEVERILSMVDGVVLLCDSAEGPLPQTKFVLSKALKLGLRPIVLINKVDRQDARPDEVHDEIFDLFANLDASNEQLDFPTLFAVGRDGWAVADLEKDERKDLTPLFNLILRHVPAPERNLDAPFSMLATTLEADPYLGRILTGRIATGRAKLNMAIKAISRDGSLIEQGRASKLLAFRGLQRIPVEEAEAGDIIALAGLAKANVADTLCAPEIGTPLTAQPIDPPTLAMTFTVNDSPLAGTEGDKLTSRVIKARLEREAEGNVAIRITESADKDSFEVAGRGELQLGVLIETMRREGFELSISRPRVLFREENGQRMEPIEEVVVDVDEEFSGTVVEKMSLRKAEMTDMRPSGGGKLRITFLAPSRGLIGYHSEFLTDTRGTGIMNRLYHSYAPYKGPIEGRRTGVLISNGKGEAVAYALFNLLDRGPQFVVHNDKVYEGMIVGEHTRSNDLEVNVLKGKQLTNIRAAGKDEAVRLPPPKKMTLEEALSYIQDDELVEVTPKSIRLRKRFLDPNERKRAAKAGTFA
ncbi:MULTISPECIES: translational GTPase TypA [unclassified Haematospirillum]|uniref:translational GTPase TypA n=1 Tax=unclassified Haematospirillum TaxID=2622088 RepID=UPI00143BDD99|nr:MULTISPECIES: translational GTPase TypA [unclassified Haematospirillum]NKD55771.1 translational GTPase TypA [Haematospirillum sp. H4890]NKD75794.1 translational GTPase TypA [Haematospirillum sp. H4485]NKD88207.1 translational GTPase TypA [Haematospirillum sp. 15-248]